MKNIAFSVLTLFSICLLTIPAQAQKSNKKIQTEAFSVSGVCNMCKTRIEKAALQAGVISADWDKDSQELKVIYKPKKVALEAVKQFVADAGHDTDKIKSTEEAYAVLPDCCAYRDGVKVH